MNQSEMQYYEFLFSCLQDLSSYLDDYEDLYKSQEKRDDATIELLRSEDRFLKAFKEFLIVVAHEANTIAIT